MVANFQGERKWKMVELEKLPEGLDGKYCDYFARILEPKQTTVPYDVSKVSKRYCSVMMQYLAELLYSALTLIFIRCDLFAHYFLLYPCALIAHNYAQSRCGRYYHCWWQCSALCSRLRPPSSLASKKMVMRLIA